MSKTHYDDWLERFPQAIKIIDETLERVENEPTLARMKDISYIMFKAINEDLIKRTTYNDSLWQTLYAIFNFKRDGKKVYEIAPNLCEKFLATHIKKVPTDLLKMPYPTILMKIPRGILEQEFADVFNGEIIKYKASVTDIYIHEGREDSRFFEGLGKMLKLYVWLEAKQKEKKGHHMLWMIFLTEPTIEECVKKSREVILRYFNEQQSEKEGLKDFEKPSETQLQFIEDVFSFVMKSLLYIVGAEADIVYEDESQPLFQKLSRVKSGGKRKEIERKLERVGLPRYKVGSRIVLSRGEKIMYDGIKKGLWNLSYRFCVAGHYREQAYGEQWKLHRVIFIDPYWKGPELADVINKDHYVK